MKISSSETAIQINGSCGKLCGIYSQPQNPSDHAACALLFHPNPTGGGNYNHKILTSIARMLRQHGIASWRFNTRGVGPMGAKHLQKNPTPAEYQLYTSDGTFDHGQGEVDDAKAMLKYVHQQVPDHRIILCGFSFGSYLAATLATNLQDTDKQNETLPNILHLLTIAPAIELFDYPKANQIGCPWSMLQTLDDEVVSPTTNLSWTKNQPQINLTTWPQGGHFFHGLMPEIQTWAWQEISRSLSKL